MVKEKASIVIFAGDLDKILAAFNIAIGAATMGMEVTMFFTFWGLNAILKEKKLVHNANLKQTLMASIDKSTRDSLPLSKYNMAGLGAMMMKKLMKDDYFPQVKELIETAEEFGVKFLACTTTIKMLGIDKSAFVDQVKDFVGVATYLKEAKDSKLNLFIS